MNLFLSPVLKFSSRLFSSYWLKGRSFIAITIIYSGLFLSLDVINKEYICSDVFIFTKYNGDVNLGLYISNRISH